MTWLVLQLDTSKMMITIPEGNMVGTMPGKLFHMVQCCLPARYFVNFMLATLRVCPVTGHVQLTQECQRDVE